MSLYLKYRPNTFTDVVGQHFIKETLPKAISKNKLVGSYLFTGPKGTGKTSLARIFAKGLNCLDFKDDLCGICKNCKEIEKGQNIDVIEIDAASNSSVDNIKDIIKQCRFQPNNNHKYKVYIIDEVHMLSKSAFNALLKIMEEPPIYVKFILATTELDKIPETILSRCQTYTFGNINKTDIENRLIYIAKEEHIRYDQEGLDIIYKLSEGSLRNAIKLLEQYSSNDNSIEGKYISDNIGLISENVIKDLLKNLYLKENINYNKTIEIYNDIILSGKDIKLFIRDICFYLVDKLKNEYSKQIPNKENIEIYTFMLDEFEKGLIKMKSSIDTNTTFLAILGKIISKK